MLCWAVLCVFPEKREAKWALASAAWRPAAAAIHLAPSDLKGIYSAKQPIIDVNGELAAAATSGIPGGLVE